MHQHLSTLNQGKERGGRGVGGEGKGGIYHAGQEVMSDLHCTCGVAVHVCQLLLHRPAMETLSAGLSTRQTSGKEHSCKGHQSSAEPSKGST